MMPIDDIEMMPAISSMPPDDYRFRRLPPPPRGHGQMPMMPMAAGRGRFSRLHADADEGNIWTFDADFVPEGKIIDAATFHAFIDVIADDYFLSADFCISFSADVAFFWRCDYRLFVMITPSMCLLMIFWWLIHGDADVDDAGRHFDFSRDAFSASSADYFSIFSGKCRENYRGKTPSLDIFEIFRAAVPSLGQPPGPGRRLLDDFSIFSRFSACFGWFLDLMIEAADADYWCRFAASRCISASRWLIIFRHFFSHIFADDYADIIFSFDAIITPMMRCEETLQEHFRFHFFWWHYADAAFSRERPGRGPPFHDYWWCKDSRRHFFDYFRFQRGAGNVFLRPDWLRRYFSISITLWWRFDDVLFFDVNIFFV